jgi:adenylate cyclase
MATEIERKFLVTGDGWRDQADQGVRYRQGYLTSLAPGGEAKVSIRVRMQGSAAYLNIKSATLGIRRQEFEYPIPAADAKAMLEKLCVGAVVEKTRYHVTCQEHVWEIDVFHGDNAGLIVAELELTDEHEVFARPAWLGDEVSEDTRYYNVCLAQHPYKDW